MEVQVAVQPGAGADAGRLLHEELAGLHGVDHRARHFDTVHEGQAVAGVQVRGGVQHQAVALDRAHLADELA